MRLNRSEAVNGLSDLRRSCPLCLGEDFKQDVFRRPVFFADKLSWYVRCCCCGSRSLTPMPDPAELKALYAAEYFEQPEDGLPLVGGLRDHSWVLENLPDRGDGLFVDLGCGNGDLLRIVADHGYEVHGFDVDKASVEAASRRSGCSASHFGELPSFAGMAASVHLGDVIEHVTDPALLLEDVITLLKPGGLLLAQGPLEANRSLFNIALAVSAMWNRLDPVTDPPHHVHLVSQRGQETLFSRLGFETIDFRVWDVSWPAPEKFEKALLRDRRRLGLFFFRWLSSTVRPIAPRVLSNRFNYVGRLPSRER